MIRTKLFRTNAYVDIFVDAVDVDVVVVVNDNNDEHNVGQKQHDDAKYARKSRQLHQMCQPKCCVRPNDDSHWGRLLTPMFGCISAARRVVQKPDSASRMECDIRMLSYMQCAWLSVQPAFGFGLAAAIDSNARRIHFDRVIVDAWMHLTDRTQQRQKRQRIEPGFGSFKVN